MATSMTLPLGSGSATVTEMMTEGMTNTATMFTMFKIASRASLLYPAAILVLCRLGPLRPFFLFAATVYSK